MKQQDLFNRVMELYNPTLGRLITRHLFAGQPSSRKPLTSRERKSVTDLGIELGRLSRFSHADVTALAKQHSSLADRDRICDAFVLSLDSRYTKFRAPLQALALTSNVSRHRYVAWRPSDGDPTPCAKCGCDRSMEVDALEAAHFIIRQGTCGSDSSLVEAAWCLNWFCQADVPKLTSAHRQKFRGLLKVFDAASPKATSAKIASQLGPVLGGNKYSRESFIETMGLAGILRVDTLPGLLQHWTAWNKRPQGGEMIAPASLWRRRFGFNSEVFRQLFPSFKLPPGLASPQSVG